MVQIIYTLLALIDELVYGIASSLLGLISDLANTQFFTDQQIGDIANRVYIVVGVLMLFKLVVSAVQYLVNPDVFEDKEKGLTGILKKTAISIALIVLVPSIFSFLVQIQTPIVKSLPDIVLGSGTTDKTDESSIGFDLSFKILSAFVKPNTSAKSVPSSAKGIGKGYDIHDFPSFVNHVADGCPGINLFGLAGNMKENCYYDYMIIISTLCGGFLCYVLLSMVLDISIRTIKFGIIQMLAPIPIASYVINKDRLNKFVKTATTVYLDLFIRMIIIYFIIFAIKAIIIENNILNIANVNGGGVANTGDWFRNVVVNIALIFGLLMFAKSAPKFISELLGLPDIGAGEMADMFKPAWQRAGGAAGALINPGRNAVSNYRKAMENNTDMSSKGKRIRNALRHAAGGFGKGALDAAQGIMAGDDWAKIQQRHDASVKNSSRHSAASYMKRTDKMEADSRNAEVNARRKELQDFFKSEGIDINARKKYFSSIANDAYKHRLGELNTQISDLQARLATDTSLTSEQYAQKSAELRSMIAERDRMTSAAGKKEWITNKTNEFVAAEVYSAEVTKKNARKADIATELANARAAYVTSSGEEQAKWGAKIAALTEEEQEIDASLADPEKLKSTIAEFVGTGTLKPEAVPNISTSSIARARIDKFFGGEGFTGQGYTDVADVLAKNREALWQKESMGKLSQAPGILRENDHFELASTTLTYSINGEDGHGTLTYSTMYDLYTKAESGTLTDADRTKIAALGFKSDGDLRAAFKDVEKQAASVYVKMANDGRIDNPAIVEGIKRMKAVIASANITKEERDALLADLSANPGRFLKNASTLQEKLRTKGSRISAYNSGKKDA